MSFEYKRLTEITTLDDTVGVIFSNPAGKQSYVRMISLHNANSQNEIVKLYNVPDTAGSVGSAADTNKIFERVFAANESLIIEYPVPGMILADENDTIQGGTDTVSKVTIEITGGQE